MGGDIVTKKIVEKNNTSLDFQILGKRRGTCIISTEIQLRHTQKKEYSNVKRITELWNSRHASDLTPCLEIPK